MGWIHAFLLISAGLSMMLMLLLRRFVAHWSHRRSLFIASAAVPFLAWFTLFVIEVTLIIRHHLYEPDEPFMAGVFILLFIPMLFIIVTDMAAILGMLAVMKALRPRAWGGSTFGVWGRGGDLSDGDVTAITLICRSTVYPCP